MAKKLRNKNNKILKKGDKLTEQEYSNHSGKTQEKFRSMIESKGIIPDKYKTKKFKGFFQANGVIKALHLQSHH